MRSPPRVREELVEGLSALQSCLSGAAPEAAAIEAFVLACFEKVKGRAGSPATPPASKLRAAAVASSV
ncbi:MAG: hypothetical protein ACREJ3_08075 [Polyangiaceae bacterium]